MTSQRVHPHVFINTANNSNILDAKAVLPLKYLSNFWSSLDLSLFSCEIELDLPWSKECVISEISIIFRIAPNLDANPPVQAMPPIQRTGAIF